MENVNYSNYDLIKAILASNLEEVMKEAITNRLINYWHPQPLYYNNLTYASSLQRG